MCSLGRTRAVSSLFAVVIVAAALGVAGCGAAITVPPPTAEEVPKMKQAGNYPEHVYRIEPNDTLSIRYTFHPEMNQDAIVEPDGKIMATRIGRVPVAGLTTGELEAFRRKYEKMASAARRKIDKGGVDIDSPEPG